MTVATAQPPVAPVELAALDEEGLFEIIDGKRVEKQMGSLSTKTAGIVITELGLFLKTTPLGDMYPEQSYECFPHNPGGFRRPDISFIAASRLPEVPDEGHIPIPPDLAIEIVSPNDTVYVLDERIADYQSVGVKLIWVINPQARVLRIYRPDHSFSELQENETLSGEGVLPDFSIAVKDLLPPRKPK